jgi:FkbM family methyltransferase
VNVRGIELELHPSPDYVSDHIRETGDFYEIAILEEIERRLRDVPVGVLVDVGAMIGNHTAYLAAFVPHTRIDAFEPAPVNLELLERNVRPFPEVVIHRAALSDRYAELAMAIAADNRGWSTVKATDPGLVGGMAEFTAPAAPLDALELQDVRLVKIDVEHHEHQVLAGAVDTLARCRPLVVIEDWERDLQPVMEALGYRLAVEWADAHQTYLYEAA